MISAAAILPSAALILSDRTREQNLQRRGTGDKAEAWLRVLSMTLMIFILRPSIQKPAT